MESTGLASEKWMDIPSIALSSAIFYGIFHFPQFQFAKPLAYAWIPLAIIVTIGSLIKFISLDFFNKWEDSFGTAVVFSAASVRLMDEVAAHRLKRDSWAREARLMREDIF